MNAIDYRNLAATPTERMKAVEKMAKKNPGATFTWDSGEGWRTEATYQPSARRVVFVSINPHGDRIV